MTYCYIHPHKPQYFFPLDFNAHEVFKSFYQPYTLFGQISWFLLRNIALYQKIFSKQNIEPYIPEKRIRKISGNQPLMVFNRGTLGREQKITGLGWEAEAYFFIKYAESTLAQYNVKNEHYILSQLNHLTFVPKVLDFHESEVSTLLKTDVLKGSRITNATLDGTILNCLICLADINIAPLKTYESTVKSVFAHGDFCPWNLMRDGKEILVYDWEMAGIYPLGYDLFTFIFQTHFLLHPKKSVGQIVVENDKAIVYYFSKFNIENWQPFLKAFTELKVSLEKEKNKEVLLQQYQTLLDNVQKA